MIIFFILMWFAICTFAVWAFCDLGNPETEYKIALCDRWRETNWYFNEDAYNDFLDNGGIDDPNG